ncbi:MAG: HAMP domain-containing histidine kinase [Microbacteriaceae bacterium]|nr:HAMP domain-containing histidine kinase [Microbacteriaceae bacterium]
MFDRWPLRKRLIVSSAALTAVAGILIGGATMVGIRAYLIGQLDEELVSAAQRFNSPGQGRGEFGERLTGPGTAVGTVLAAIGADGQASAIYLDDRAAPQAFSAVQLADIPTSGWGNGIRDVRIRDSGSYRMASVGTSQGSTIVMGLPTSAINRVIGRIGTFLGFLVFGIVVIVVLAGRKSVDLALRPLERMRETAQRVSGLNLAVGDATLSERVAVDEPDTEVGHLGQAFNHMLDNVDEALTARRDSEAKVRQFVADASHELRTPLTAIRGYSELTRRQEMGMSADLRHSLDRIESESIRMTALVEDLLLLARLDEGLDFDLTRIDVAKLAKDAVTDAQVASPGHEWKVKTARGATIVADRNRFYQILVNLLANARTHTPAGTVVSTSVETTADSVVITVADNGPGIPEEIRESLFERFARADTSRARSTGSTGLGLAIVDGLVRAHKGTIVVESEPGNTRFVVTIPRAPVT